MSRRRLLWQMYPSLLVISILALVAVAMYAGSSLRSFYLERTFFDLETRARLVEMQINERIPADERVMIDSLCKKFGLETATRFTVILPSGEVVGDSDEDPLQMENHGARLEIVEAFGGETGTSTRYSNTLQTTMAYVAIPVRSGDRTIGVVRAALPTTFIDDALNEIIRRILLAGLVVAALVALVSLFVSRRITRPLEQLRHGARRFARGDLEQKLAVHASEEIAVLAETMNSMAAQLDQRIKTITRQRNEQEAILSSMVEGVMAVDRDEKIININRVAARFFNVEPGQVRNRILHEVIRNTALQQLVVQILETNSQVEGEIVVINGMSRFLQVSGGMLRDAEGEGIGAVIVLNDITRVRDLESMRRDFVANVSHELRTPITSIAGFIETLLDGALDNPDDARRFLQIISKQADRLNAIIKDLLSLSYIEQAPEIKFVTADVSGVVETAMQTCMASADAKGVKLVPDLEEGIVASISPPLLEQAVVNLIDNAVKYSFENGRVEVRVRRRDRDIVVEIKDFGCGIAKEHLPRIFERFYRVDKARSRDLGGTGLGLAIVKHIALAHGGEVTVDSKPDEGSLFSIVIPIRSF